VAFTYCSCTNLTLEKTNVQNCTINFNADHSGSVVRLSTTLCMTVLMPSNGSRHSDPTTTIAFAVPPKVLLVCVLQLCERERSNVGRRAEAGVHLCVPSTVRVVRLLLLLVLLLIVQVLVLQLLLVLYLLLQLKVLKRRLLRVHLAVLRLVLLLELHCRARLLLLLLVHGMLVLLHLLQVLLLELVLLECLLLEGLLVLLQGLLLLLARCRAGRILTRIRCRHGCLCCTRRRRDAPAHFCGLATTGKAARWHLLCGYSTGGARSRRVR
jgi:hypothetical protein